jgi:hypothetical protein
MVMRNAFSSREGSTTSELLLLLYSPSTDRTENLSSIIACSLVAGETTCSQSCSLATAVVLSPVYTAVAWQSVYMSQNIILPPKSRSSNWSLLFRFSERNLI